MLKIVKVFAGVCCWFLSVNVALADQRSPYEVAELVAENIISQSSFRFIEQAAPTLQSGVYRFDFPQSVSSKPMFALTHTKLVDDPSENHRGDRSNIQLDVSHDPGKLIVFYQGDVILESESSANANVLEVDYQLNKFADSVSIDIEHGAQLLLQFTPIAKRNKVYLGFSYPSSGMTAKRVKLSESDNYDDPIYLLGTFNSAKEALDSYMSDDIQSTSWQRPTLPPLRALPEALDFSDWRYFTGTFLDALHQVSTQFEGLNYQKYINQHVEFFLEHHNEITAERQRDGILSGPFGHYHRFQLLDDFGPQTVPLLNRIYHQKSSRPSAKAGGYDAVIARAVTHIKEKVPRLADGTLARVTPFELTVQSDDLFMGGLLLARAGRSLDRPDLLDDLSTQMLNFHNYLIDEETGLYRHGYYAPLENQTSTSWGRGIGWMAMMYVEALATLPSSHPNVDQIKTNFIKLCNALAKYQGLDGRWHQIVNDPASYPETSATAMFTRAFAEGVANGWLPSEPFAARAKRGWNALDKQINEEGEVSGIVRGTPIFADPEDYQNHKTRFNDPRGLGSVLYAAVAMEQMRQKIQKEAE